MNTLTTKQGRQLQIDLSKWKVDKNNRHCKIIETSGENIILENTHGDQFPIPGRLIKENNLIIINQKVELTEGLYEHWFLSKFRKESKTNFDVLYEKNASFIFQNRNIVLNKAEYYLLKPSSLSTGFMYSGGINYSLGKLFESFESGNHIYFEELCGYKKMYLLTMAASPLSGTIYKTTFCFFFSNEILIFNSKSIFNDNLSTRQGWELLRMLQGEEITIDRQDKAIINLINEINETRKY